MKQQSEKKRAKTDASEKGKAAKAKAEEVWWMNKWPSSSRPSCARSLVRRLDEAEKEFEEICDMQGGVAAAAVVNVPAERPPNAEQVIGSAKLEDAASLRAVKCVSELVRGSCSASNVVAGCESWLPDSRPV